MYRFADGSDARIGQRATVNGERAIVLALDPGARDPQLRAVIGEDPSLFDDIPDKIHQTAEALPE